MADLLENRQLLLNRIANHWPPFGLRNRRHKRSNSHPTSAPPTDAAALAAITNAARTIHPPELAPVAAPQHRTEATANANVPHPAAVTRPASNAPHHTGQRFMASAPARASPSPLGELSDGRRIDP
jgi:hypothetical protein